MTMSSKGQGGVLTSLVRCNPIEHRSWQQRINREERDAILSLQQGVELGIVPQLFCVRSTSVPPVDKIKDQQLAKMLQRDNLPADTLNGIGSIDSKTVKQSLNKSNRKNNNLCLGNMLHEYHLTPFGLYPLSKPEVEGKTSVIYQVPNSLRTAKHTYLGPEKQAYMKSTIDITQPDYEKISIKNKLAINTLKKLLNRNNHKSININEIKDELKSHNQININNNQVEEENISVMCSELASNFGDKNSEYFRRINLVEYGKKHHNKRNSIERSPSNSHTSRKLNKRNLSVPELVINDSNKLKLIPPLSILSYGPSLQQHRSPEKIHSSRRYHYPDLSDPASLIEGIKKAKCRYKVAQRNNHTQIVLDNNKIKTILLPPLTHSINDKSLN